MIIFERVSSKNFFSVGNQPVEILLNKSPTTLIVGHNGSGKSSTILDSIYFGLFGKPFRNINKPNVVNSLNGGDCVVEIDFTINNKKYRVIRGMKPNKFEIYENNKLIDQDAATRDYQKYLEENILGGLNERVFKQVVVIGSADYKPFMQLPAAQRREVIEELLDIKIFSQMLDIAKEKMSIIKESLREIDYNIELSQEKINIQKENRKKQKEENLAKKTQLQEKISIEQKNIEEYNSKIKESQIRKEDYIQKLSGQELVEKSIKDLNNLLNNLRNTLKTNKSTVDFFHDKDSCPTCKQNIAKEHKECIVKSSQDKIKEVQDAISRVDNELDKKQKYMDAFDKIQAAINKIDKIIYQFQSDISSSQKYITALQNEISDLSNSKIQSDSADVLKDLEQSHVVLKNRRIELMEDRQYYEVASSMLKDGGIKTKIIRQYIPIMNKIINEYLVRFGLPIEFTLDEQFNEVIKSRYRDGFQYNNFSEGEKQRIDTALLLAWRTIAKSKNTTNTNLLIMDETFDSSLDAGATEELLNILLEMDKHTNIFIISHKSDLSDKLRSQIEFEKSGNFTRIKTR